MHKVKGIINKTICTTAGVGVLVFGSMLDNPTLWQYTAFALCSAVVLVYGIANGWVD